MSYRARLGRAAVAGIRTALHTALAPLGRTNRERLTMELVGALTPNRRVQISKGKSIEFACPSYDTLWRADTFSTKEPDTLQWIDSFAPTDILWDIGANVGLYTLYAAVSRGIRVIAFEPSAANYWLLNKNIQLNGVDSAVTAYCLALADASRAGTFNMGDMNLGGALYQFGDFVSEFHYAGVGRQSVMFHQAVLGYAADDFVAQFGVPSPNHIKIDIDGNEEEVLRGAQKLLASPQLRSILVELEVDAPGLVQRVTDGLAVHGFDRPKEVETIAGSKLHNFIFRKP